MCTHYNKGSHMLSIIDTWGHMNYFFKSGFVIATTGFSSVSLMQMNWCLVPQQIKCKVMQYQELWSTGIHHKTGKAIFTDKGSLPNYSMTALLLATDDAYIHNQCQQSIFALKNRFHASLTIIHNRETLQRSGNDQWHRNGPVTHSKPII